MSPSQRGARGLPESGVARRPRRSPSPAERRRDPERTRERILRAAVDEFGDHGYAGARVSRIAARAGVNAQLISYYFDGKAGLYQALLARWRRTATELARPGRPLDAVVASFVRASSEHRSWARLMVWQALGDSPEPAAGRSEGADGPAGGADGEPDFLLEQVADLSRRQAAGELPADLDPAYLLLALFGASSAGVVLPGIARRIVGLDPTSEEFLTRYTEQIARLVRHIASERPGRRADGADTPSG
jgi:AcrR family transcriptional regulator